MRRAGIIILSALLGACARQPEPVAPPQKPISEMSFPERCAHLIEMSGNVYATPAQKSAFYELARNQGCMGNPPPQTVIVQ